MNNDENLHVYCHACVVLHLEAGYMTESDMATLTPIRYDAARLCSICGERVAVLADPDETSLQ